MVCSSFLLIANTISTSLLVRGKACVPTGVGFLVTALIVGSPFRPRSSEVVLWMGDRCGFFLGCMQTVGLISSELPQFFVEKNRIFSTNTGTFYLFSWHYWFLSIDLVSRNLTELFHWVSYFFFLLEDSLENNLNNDNVWSLSVIETSICHLISFFISFEDISAFYLGVWLCTG